MKLSQITENLKELSGNYGVDAEITANQIEKFIAENGFKTKEIPEAGRITIYGRDSEDLNDVTDELTVNFDVEHNRVGITARQYCEFCGEVLDAGGDEVEVCECDTRRVEFEVCSNAEWIEQNLECPENPDSAEISEVVKEEIERFDKLCVEAGIVCPLYVSPKKGRSLYHGWNGAGFRYKNGIFGTFNRLKKKQ